MTVQPGALNATVDATLVVDAADVIVEANQPALDLFGRPRVELVGAPVGSLVRGLDVVDETMSARVDATALLPGGELAVHAWRRRIDEARSAVILRDATEWLTAQSTLALVVTGVEKSVDSFEITDEHGNIEYANESHALATGHALFDVLGQSITRFIDGDDKAAVGAALHAGESWRGEIECTLPNGEVRTHDLTLTPVADALSGTRRYVVIRRDVTARVLAERKVEELREQLAHADRLGVLGQLAASVAHDVNNPATFILANLRLALDELETWKGEGDSARHSIDARIASLTEMLADALDGTERVIALVRGMRSLGTREPPARQPTSLADVARDAIKMTRATTRARARVAEHLAAPAIVIGDRVRLGQVVVNLLVNAAQAIAAGDVDGNCIIVSTRDGQGFAELTVADTGKGIPAEHLERVFEPFFTTKPPGEGTGLGLAVSRQIVAELGGTLTASRAPERGTVLTLRLPSSPRSSSPVKHRCDRAT